MTGYKVNQLTITENPETVPEEHRGKQHNRTVNFDTATSHLVIGVHNNKRICSVIFIMNKEQGNGNAGKLMKCLESYARQCRCKEIWYPCVVSQRLIQILLKHDYKLQIHKDEHYGEDVDVFVKEFRKQDR